jgi:arginase
MMRRIGLIGVPSSAGASWPGQDKAPQALRSAGLVARLEAAGWHVVDHGDLPRVLSQPDPDNRRAQNLAAVVNVVRSVANQVDVALREGEVPLVIGGDCTITIGVVSGYLRRHDDLALLYLDGHIDLYSPATDTDGILDSMGVAHMIGEPGAAEELAHIGPRYPLLPEDRIVFFGDDITEPDGPEAEVLARRTMYRCPAERVRGRPMDASVETLRHLEGLASRFLMHFDLDAVDFVDFPAADVPQFNAGLTFAEAIESLHSFAMSPRFGGFVVTEFNPDHAAEERNLAADLVQGIADVLSIDGRNARAP